MRFAMVVAMLLFVSGTSFADVNASRFKIENGKMIVAQSYCGMCVNSATSCRSACNGAGACIQACDDKLRDCREQNCGSRSR